ncbi:DEAD/DEAH box helicase [Halobacillus sp. A1]|uniref:DEAD/DEAH box helicase n=1 Tax=Halobacillus sp. A1 TaxID=2880262 RepID=UPI0020A68CF0|nr:DEAD/DEAH box helicase [Halobacillus sp. A1]MCP3031400.1 DEAD/DEAH box helicase [Halobacillus sp. A1]
MQSYLLQPKDIIKITGQTFYERGEQYYKQGKVYALSHNSAIRSWRAVVTGTHDYEVRVFFFEDDDLEARCECPAYDTYFSCKHIAAVLCAIREQAIAEASPKLTQQAETAPEQTDHKMDRVFAMRLYETFRDRQENRYTNSSKQALNIQYYLHIQSLLGSKNLALEVKLGEDYPYVIKDIRSLLQHIRQDQPYRISKKFTYDPADHYFKDDDLKIIEKLHGAYEQELFYDRHWNSGEQRVLTIPPALAPDLMKNLAPQYCEVIERGSAVGQLELMDDFPELDFYIAEERGMYHLHMNQLKNFEYLKEYHLLYNNACFYPLAPEKEEVIRTLHYLLPYNSNGNHTVGQVDMEGIVSYVLPELKSIANVRLDPSAQSKIVQEDLTTKVYLDFEQWALTVDVSFVYGDHTLHPFKKQSVDNQQIIQRDRETEQSIIHIIEQAEFKFDGETVYLEEDEALDRFLIDYLPQLAQIADVYTSNSVKSIIDNQDRELVPSVDIESDGSWLDVKFGIDGISEDDVSNALRAAIERKKYYRLSDGALLSLTSESFERFQTLAEELDLASSDIDGSSLQVSKARSLQVNDALALEEKERNERFSQLVQRLQSPQSFNIDPPDTLEAELRSYQLTGFRWLKTLSTYGLGGVLADDMGLGKTVQSIAFLLYEKTEGLMEQPAIIVTPASLVYNWKKEIEKFSPTLTVQVITGDPISRSEQIQKASADILITSYPLLRQDITFYEGKTFHAIILDEAQAIKNESTKTSQAVRSLKAKHRFALSGTPIENSLTELWSLFRTIMPGFYTSKKKFLQMKPEKIARMTRPFILRRMKTEVLEELPDKIETVQYSELTRPQKEVYLAYLEKIQSEVKETIATKGIQRGKLEILAGLTRLRQICCHPALFLENYEGESGKLEQLKELVSELKAGGHRVLIFSQFASMLKLMYEELTTTGLEAFYLDGSTKSEARVEMVERFNQGENDAFFISLKAGGTGLNLTGADTVILYDLWWNPAIEEQAAGRAHRIGQEKVVQVIRMISEGTIEERIFQLQQKKRDLVDQIIQPGESMLSSLSEEEIRNLFQ